MAASETCDAFDHSIVSVPFIKQTLVFWKGDVKSQEQQAEVVTTRIKHRLKINRLIVRTVE